MPRRLSSSAARTHGGNMLFMLPTIILFCIVVLIPFFQGIPYSFTNWKSIVSETKEFNGLKNYIYLIKNKYFQDSLLVTFKFTILYMISANVMGLLLALAIHRSSWFNNIARTVLFLPFTVSVTAGSIVWSYVFTDVYGTITGLVSPLGMPGQIIYGMVVIGAWRDMGYTMLIYIAALQAVPQDYYEAATVDGAGKLRQFFSVTVPNIVPAFTTNVTLLLAWGLRTFDMPMAVARNAREGQFTAVYVYDSIFSNNKAGLGQAAAVILTIILVVLTQIVTRSLRRLEVEQ
ncbi:MAG: sugar ABC transporter permease [Firmicutes bacterium]|jgi:ABC-type sugar transport system permease subunit|nr:sugar ABC transporter permease [Bacillota bacterium]